MEKPSIKAFPKLHQKFSRKIKIEKFLQLSLSLYLTFFSIIFIISNLKKKRYRSIISIGKVFDQIPSSKVFKNFESISIVFDAKVTSYKKKKENKQTKRYYSSTVLSEDGIFFDRMEQNVPITKFRRGNGTKGNN